MSEKFSIEKIRAWLSSLDSYHIEIAIAVAHHLQIKDDEVDNAIIDILQTHDDIKIRRSAINFIYDREDLKFLEILIESLDDQDWCIQGKSFLTIKKIMPNWIENEKVKKFMEGGVHPFVTFCIAQQK
jgi:hypothetical protein